MKILILSDRIPPENRGGAGIIAWQLATGFWDMGHEVHVIAATKGEPFESKRGGIFTYHLHSDYPERFHAFTSLKNQQTIEQVEKLYQRIKPDVINAHNIHADLSYHCLTIAHKMGIPAVFSSHDVMPFAYQKLTHFINPNSCDVPAEAYRLPPFYNLRKMRFRYNPLRNLTIRRILTQDVQARTVPSHELAKAHKANGLPSFQVVHNGIDSKRYDIPEDKIESTRRQLKVERRKVILFAGRLTGGKGMFQVMDMMQQVIKDVPDVLLLVLSSHEISTQIKQPEYQHLKHEYVQSGGWLYGTDLIAATKVADLVIVPSVIFDTFPNMNLEGMAAGKPVIATCYGGSKEAVVDGETGYIINPHDIDDFAAKVTRLLTDKELNRRMGAAGSRRIEEHFSLDKHVNGMMQIFVDITSNTKKVLQFPLGIG